VIRRRVCIGPTGWEVSSTDTGLVMTGPGGTVEALPIDDCTFLVDAGDPDEPTVTLGAFDDGGRPGVLYEMLWRLPRARTRRASLDAI
jgi:hypothetical protein